jgi:hypothetical protein
MPISSNNTHISFNNNSTQNTAFLGTIAAANITGQITAPQIAPGVVPAAGMTGQIFASTTAGPSSWTAPPTTTRIKVTVVGGGGGAGVAYGAGGGTGIRSIPVVGGTPYPYTIGAGGPGPGTGGTTSFGSPAVVSATGGAAGVQCSASSGGSGSGGDINLVGDGTTNNVIGAIPGQGGEQPTPPSPFGYGLFAGGSFLAGRKTSPGVGNPFGGGGMGSTPPGVGFAGGSGGIIIEF